MALKDIVSAARQEVAAPPSLMARRQAQAKFRPRPRVAQDEDALVAPTIALAPAAPLAPRRRSPQKHMDALVRDADSPVAGDRGASPRTAKILKAAKSAEDGAQFCRTSSSGATGTSNLEPKAPPRPTSPKEGAPDEHKAARRRPGPERRLIKAAEDSESDMSLIRTVATIDLDESADSRMADADALLAFDAEMRRRRRWQAKTQNVELIGDLWQLYVLLRQPGLRERWPPLVFSKLAEFIDPQTLTETELQHDTAEEDGSRNNNVETLRYFFRLYLELLGPVTRRT